MLRLADGTFAEGFIDLSFREEDGTWTVVDFKTDRELETHRARYEEQVRLYMAAVASATGAEAKGFLLVV